MESSRSSSSPSASERLPVPTHMQHVASLSSMAALSEGSQSDLEMKSGSSGIGLELDSPSNEWYYRLLDVDSDQDSSSLCAGNMKEYISDLTLLSHAAVMGDRMAMDGKDRQPHKQLSSSITENACSSTYKKWRNLSGPMLLFLVLGIFILIWGRSHLLQLLQWLEHLPLHRSMLVFMFLFTLISFPFGFGYIILNMMAGYLYGIVRGQLIVMVSVAVGLSISFLLCKRWFRNYAESMVTSNNAMQAVLKVVQGPHGFKVIFLTRFTPIPFGLQNVLFAVSLQN